MSRAFRPSRSCPLAGGQGAQLTSVSPAPPARWPILRSTSSCGFGGSTTRSTRSRCFGRARIHPRRRRGRMFRPRGGTSGKGLARIRTRTSTRLSAGCSGLSQIHAGYFCAEAAARGEEAWAQWLWAPCAGRRSCEPWRAATQACVARVYLAKACRRRIRRSPSGNRDGTISVDRGPVTSRLTRATSSGRAVAWCRGVGSGMPGGESPACCFNGDQRTVGDKRAVVMI